MKINIIVIRDNVKCINFIFFIFFLIIGFYTYQGNEKDIEPCIIGININHFSTFFGGSSFVLFLLLTLSKCLKIQDNKLHIELFTIIISVIATLWFTYDDEIEDINNLNYSEILGNIFGFIAFLIINILIYIAFNKYLERDT